MQSSFLYGAKLYQLLRCDFFQNYTLSPTFQGFSIWLDKTVLIYVSTPGIIQPIAFLLFFSDSFPRLWEIFPTTNE
jgi:hypothetical protein